MGSVREAREFVRERLETAGCTPDTIDSAVLLTGELASNVVDHTRSPVILVDVEDGDQVHVGIGDMDADHRALAPVKGDADRPRGRGLLLVDGIAHRWGVTYRTGGKAVWFELPFP